MPAAAALLLACSSISPFVLSVAALDNGLGLTPPLAYSTWNFFNDAINDTLVRELADGLVSTGLVDLGYRSVLIVNDCVCVCVIYSRC